MKNSLRLLYNVSSLLVIMLMVCGCTASVDHTDENGLKPHLTVDLQVPAKIEANQSTILSLAVHKGNLPFEQAEEAIFTIWLEDTPEQKTSIPAVQYTPGIYEVAYTFHTEGLYIVQSHVLSSNMEVLPAKRVAVGAEAVERLVQLELQKNDIVDVAPAAGHSHH